MLFSKDGFILSTNILDLYIDDDCLQLYKH